MFNRTLQAPSSRPGLIHDFHSRSCRHSLLRWVRIHLETIIMTYLARQCKPRPTVPFIQALQTTFRHNTAPHQAVRCFAVCEYTYGELDELARQGAGRLQSLGVESGDRVVLCTADKLAFLLAHLATLYAGGISLPLNPRFTREELRFFLSDSGASCVAIVGDECASSRGSIASRVARPAQAVVSDGEIRNELRRNRCVSRA